MDSWEKALGHCEELMTWFRNAQYMDAACV
jgi:hypothetical protein